MPRARRWKGWAVVESYCDRAISGSSLIRPGIRSLLADVQAGRFDMVLSKRSTASAAIRKKRASSSACALRTSRIVTLSEGEINELHVGLKGTMNALFLKDLALKTHRGIRGRVEAGKIGGGNAYGYRVVQRWSRRRTGPGRARHREEQAEIVRRIFREYVAGKGPKKIAADLNREGIPARAASAGRTPRSAATVPSVPAS